MFNLGRILTGLATVAAVLVGAALGAPALMSWDHLRGPAEAEAGALLGAPVRIDGRITAQLLPSPRLSFSNVVVEPQSGHAVSGDFARARVYLAFWPLLSGKAEPRALAFSGADLLVDRAVLAGGDGLKQLGLPVSVEEGRLRFEADHAAAEITKLVFRAGPGRPEGMDVRLSGVFREAPFSARAVLRGQGPTALRSAAVNFGDGQAVLSFLRAAAPDGGAEIRLKLNRGEGAAALLRHVVPVAGHLVPAGEIARLAPLSLAVLAVPEGDAYSLRALELTAGQLRITGNGRLRPGARPALDLELGARTLVLGDGPGGFDPSGILRVVGQLAEWGEALEGGLRLHADHVLAGDTVMRQSELHLSFGPEGTRLDRFRIALPGGLLISGQGIAAEPGRLAAAVRLDGARLTDIPGISGLTESSTSNGNLPMNVEGQLVLSGARAALNDLRITAGRNSVRVGGALFFGERTELDVQLEAETLDLRALGLTRESLTPRLRVKSLWNSIRKLAARINVTARMEIGAVRLTDATFRDGILDLALDNRQIVLRRMSIEEEGGRAIEARLRLPLEPPRQREKRGEPAPFDWITRTEAAIDLRAAGTGGISWRAGLWDGVLSLETESPLRGRVTGRLGEKEGEFRWSDIRGRIGRASMSGELLLTPGEKPVLRGSIHSPKAAIVLAGGTGDALWPDWNLADFWPQGIEVHLDWSAEELQIAGAQLNHAGGTATLEGDAVRLVLVNGSAFGGSASGFAQLTRGDGADVSMESQGVVQRADLTVLMGGGWKGRGLIRQSTSASGANILEIVSGLRGTLGLKFEEGRIGGFDAGALANALPGARSQADVQKAVDRALGSGGTLFRRLEGEARISNGELIVSGISAQTERGPVMLAGIVSLPARLIAAQADISLGDKVGVPLSVQFIGRIEAPERIVDTERLAKRLGQ